MPTHQPIVDLASHPEPFVTVTQLAQYWRVSRKQIYKQIDAGVLDAVRLGQRMYRIKVPVALRFEEEARMHAETTSGRTVRQSC